MKNWLSYLSVLILAMTMFGCGGGSSSSSGGSSGSSGTATVNCASGSLCPPSQVTIVQPKDVSLTSKGYVLKALGAAPTSGSYVTDKAQMFVNNSAQQQLTQINGILCILNKTNFSDFTNQESYLAQVSQTSCGLGDNQNSSPEQAGQNSQNIMQIVVDSKRTAGGPQDVKLWATTVMGGGDGAGQPVMIKIQLTVESTPTTDNIYGNFSMNFAGFVVESDGTVTDQKVMYGYIKTIVQSNGVVELNYAESEVMNVGVSQIAVVQAANGTGYATLSQRYGSQSSATTAAFNSDLLSLDSDGAGVSPSICYNRDDPTTVVYGYGVYKNDGSRLSNDSGFPIVYNGQHGFLSFYGLWLPLNSLPDNGAPITKINMNGNSEDGSLVATNGIMQNNIRKSYTLNQLSGVQMSVNVGQSGQVNYNDILVWNSSTQLFNKVGTGDCSPNGCFNVPLAIPEVVGQAYFESVAQWSGNSIYVALNGLGRGGNTQLKIFDSCQYDQQSQTFSSCSGYNAANNESILNVWQNVIEIPVSGSESMTLYCVDSCPVESNGSIIYNYPVYDGSGGEHQYLTYTYYKGLASDESYVLVDPNGNPLVVNSSMSPQIFSGPLLTESQLTNLSAAGEGSIFPYLIYTTNIITAYRQWTSGSQVWNRYYSFKSESGEIANFNPPLQLVYNDANNNANFLQYMGFGNLQGIPGICVSESGATVDGDCGRLGNTWRPSFTIPEGTALTSMDFENLQFWVRQLNIAQLLNSVNTSECSSALGSEISLANALTLPSLDAWVNPDIGSKPNIESAPKVIDGVNQ